uniref:Uncharacterized protein n=1 Tax=Corethron hystrix TaxID=216773 RepID=A0A7S1B6B2_9STRA|mmetsp:Transcript_14351/g.31405  ORF Transcript_14351/g.31405 Transcript_14351/m.31405 type:complete len:556 (+) Transcript_14351:408-2075(+)
MIMIKMEVGGKKKATAKTYDQNMKLGEEINLSKTEDAVPRKKRIAAGAAEAAMQHKKNKTQDEKKITFSNVIFDTLSPIATATSAAITKKTDRSLSKSETLSLSSPSQSSSASKSFDWDAYIHSLKKIEKEVGISKVVSGSSSSENMSVLPCNISPEHYVEKEVTHIQKDSIATSAKSKIEKYEQNEDALSILHKKIKKMPAAESKKKKNLKAIVKNFCGFNDNPKEVLVHIKVKCKSEADIGNKGDFVVSSKYGHSKLKPQKVTLPDLSKQKYYPIKQVHQILNHNADFDSSMLEESEIQRQQRVLHVIPTLPIQCSVHPMPCDISVPPMAIKTISSKEKSSSSSHWVRRSTRHVGISFLQSPRLKALLALLCYPLQSSYLNYPLHLSVLHLKNYLHYDLPVVAMDALLRALHGNSRVQALYIQHFKCVSDAQMTALLEVLQHPSCNIWCINVGEIYNVSNGMWEDFAVGLRSTKVTHMYASEHTISNELKKRLRNIIRNNRRKHNMHNNVENLDVIVRCTHCWWNPINSRGLRSFVKSRNEEHLLGSSIAKGR